MRIPFGCLTVELTAVLFEPLMAIRLAREHARDIEPRPASVLALHGIDGWAGQRIADIADAIQVEVRLVWIRCPGAVVGRVYGAVVVIIRVAVVARSVAVVVGPFRRVERQGVVFIEHAVGIEVDFECPRIGAVAIDWVIDRRIVVRPRVTGASLICGLSIIDSIIYCHTPRVARFVAQYGIFTTFMNDKRHMLRHFLAALAYRTQKALRDAPEDFGDFASGNHVRTPKELVRHMTSVLGYARTFFVGGEYQPEPLRTLQEEVDRFHEMLEQLRSSLDSEMQLNGLTEEQLLQGQFSDAMTHAGQLAILRRLHGAPVPSENFIHAAISADNLTADQPDPVAPDDDWHRLRR